MLRDDYGNQENLSPLRSMEHSFRAYVKRRRAEAVSYTHLVFAFSGASRKIRKKQNY